MSDPVIGPSSATGPRPVARGVTTAPPPAPAVGFARDRVALGAVSKGMGEEPQSRYGLVLSPPMKPYAAGLERFETESLRKIDLLAEQLKQDPEYVRVSAPGVWAKLPTAQKVAFADHVAKLQGELLGFPPAKTHFKKLAPDDDGGFDDDTGLLEVNSASDASRDLGQLLNTVVHEQFHCYQHYLTHQRFPADDPRHAASEVYKLNEKQYFDAPDDSKKEPQKYARYRRQPSEAHAFTMGERVYTRLFGGT